MKVQIMSPAADRVDFKVPPAPRLASLEGKTIGLYNNVTGGADVAVDRFAEQLQQRYLESGSSATAATCAKAVPSSAGASTLTRKRPPASPPRSTPWWAPRPIEGAAHRGLAMTWSPWKRPASLPWPSSPRASPGPGRPAWTAGISPLPLTSSFLTRRPGSNPTSFTTW